MRFFSITLSSLICGLLTVNLCIHKFQINSILASVALTILFSLLSLIAKKWDILSESSFYCGSFIGMITSEIYMNIEFIAITSLIASFLLILTRKSITGLGGKLGTVAFVSGCVAKILGIP